MITRLTLSQFKNLREAEVPLGPVSLIIGANATGKSNVRDALRFLHGVARGYSLPEILGDKYGEGGQLIWGGIRGGTREVCLAGASRFALEVDFRSSLNGSHRYEALEDSLRYRIEVECLPGESPRVAAERLMKGGEGVFDTHPEGRPLPSTMDSSRIPVWLRTGAVGVGMGLRIESAAIQPFLGRGLEVAKEQGARDVDLAQVGVSIAQAYSTLGSMRFVDFSPEALRRPSIPGQVVLGDRGENLSSVLQAICGDEALKRVLSSWLQELTPMDVVDFAFESDASGRILVYLVEAGGRRISANSASDGTLRFLGVLAALLGPNPARLYVFEEIETGVHPSRLSLLMELLQTQSGSKRVQIVATTHSPQVLGLLSSDNRAFASLVYRLRGHAEGRIKALSEIPSLSEVLRTQDLAKLHETAWMETTLEFAEGLPPHAMNDGALTPP